MSWKPNRTQWIVLNVFAVLIAVTLTAHRKVDTQLVLMLPCVAAIIVWAERN